MPEPIARIIAAAFYIAVGCLLRSCSTRLVPLLFAPLRRWVERKAAHITNEEKD